MNSELLNTFINYSTSIFPWVVAGTFIAFFLEKKLNRKTITHYFSEISLKRLMLVQTLGMISPLSIMSFLPIAQELTLMGFNPGLLLSFFIAERAWDLQSFFIISGLFNVKLAVLNGIAIFISLTITAVFLRKDFVHFKAKEEVHNHFWRRQSKLILLVFLGIIFGAILRTYIPESEFQYFTGSQLSGIFSALILGFLLYFGPIVANYPIAKAFSELGMSQAGVLSFLTVSPIFNLVVITLFGATVGYKKTLKAFLIYSISALLMTILFSFLL